MEEKRKKRHQLVIEIPEADLKFLKKLAIDDGVPLKKIVIDALALYVLNRGIKI